MKLTRREFLKRAGATTALAAGFPTIIPAAALGKDGASAPSQRIVMGCIGTGGQGRGNLDRFLSFNDVQVVAVCDVDAKHRELARDAVCKKYGNQDCVADHDFRDLLDRREIDAVSICTPDHWHALASVAAANAGKDIYCEKPLANSIAEGRAICEAVKKHKRVLQTGSHERSGDNARFACELVRNGKIGRLHTIRINLPCDDAHHKKVMEMTETPPPMPVPEGFDYDFWLGHTPLAPYHEKRCHFWWRFILAYGGGEMTDRGAHVIDLAQLGAGTDETGPVAIDATGGNNHHGFYNAFFDYKFVNTFANGMRMVGSTEGPRGLKLEGDEGWIFIHVHGAKLEASNPALLQELDDWKKKDGALHEVRLGRSPGHHRNFLDSVKSRKQPVASAEIGHRTASLCHLNNIGLRLGRPLKWDPKKEKFIGDAEANDLIAPNMRAPWRLA